jgi:hypothetical protein
LNFFDAGLHVASVASSVSRLPDSVSSRGSKATALIEYTIAAPLTALKSSTHRDEAGTWLNDR